MNVGVCVCVRFMEEFRNKNKTTDFVKKEPITQSRKKKKSERKQKFVALLNRPNGSHCLEWETVEIVMRTFFNMMNTLFYYNKWIRNSTHSLHLDHHLVIITHTYTDMKRRIFRWKSKQTLFSTHWNIFSYIWFEMAHNFAVQ